MTDDAQQPDRALLATMRHHTEEAVAYEEARAARQGDVDLRTHGSYASTVQRARALLWPWQEVDRLTAQLAAERERAEGALAVAGQRERTVRRLVAERDEARDALDIQTGILEGARAALAGVADRVDQHTFDELHCRLDEGAVDEHGDAYRSRLERVRDWIDEGVDQASDEEIAALREIVS